MSICFKSLWFKNDMGTDGCWSIWRAGTLVGMLLITDTDGSRIYTTKDKCIHIVELMDIVAFAHKEIQKNEIKWAKHDLAELLRSKAVNGVVDLTDPEIVAAIGKAKEADHE